jgi:uncharacterized protein
MTANLCFVDSACWIALLSRADLLHEQATRVYQQQFQNTRLVTTTAVLNETANALSAPRFRSAILALHDRVRRSPSIEIVFVDPALWESGWQFFAARPDKEWSLTDCLSMLVCQQLNITDVLTSDHHFTQAGFKRLLNPV